MFREIREIRTSEKLVKEKEKPAGFKEIKPERVWAEGEAQAFWDQFWNQMASSNET